MEKEDLGFDLNAAVDTVAGAMGEAGEPTPEILPEPPVEGTQPLPPVPPQSWGKDFGDVYPKLDEKIRKQIEKRESDFLSGYGKYKADAEWAEKFRGTLAPYKATINSLGVDELQAAQQLFAADHTLRYGTDAQKLTLLRDIISTFKIDSKALLAPADEAPYQDPNIKPVIDRLNQVESMVTQQAQAVENARRAEVSKAVEAFSADTEKHPYFNELGDDIAKLILAGYSLEEAYERAVWANPTTRGREQTKAANAALEQRRKEAAEAAKRAKGATAANVKATPKDKASSDPVGSIDDTLRSTLQEIHSRTEH